jgi:hypothetical protein
MTTIHVIGIPQALRAFDQFPRAIRNKHLRIALSAAAGTIRDAAVPLARRQTGLLAKSLGVKLPSIGASIKAGKPISAVVGARRRFIGPAAIIGGKTKLLSLRKATKRVLSGGTVQTRRPSRYSHLIEKGHGGPRAARAYPFLEPAARSAGPAAGAKAMQKLQQGVQEEAARAYAGA